MQHQGETSFIAHAQWCTSLSKFITENWRTQQDMRFQKLVNGVGKPASNTRSFVLTFWLHNSYITGDSGNTTSISSSLITKVFISIPKKLLLCGVGLYAFIVQTVCAVKSVNMFLNLQRFFFMLRLSYIPTVHVSEHADNVIHFHAAIAGYSADWQLVDIISKKAKQSSKKGKEDCTIFKYLKMWLCKCFTLRIYVLDIC